MWGGGIGRVWVGWDEGMDVGYGVGGGCGWWIWGRMGVGYARRSQSYIL